MTDEQPSLADQRRANLAKARAAKAAGASSVVSRLNDLELAVRRLVDVSTLVLGSQTMANEMQAAAYKAFGELVAKISIRERTLERQAGPADGRGSEMARFCEAATERTIRVPTREYLDAMQRGGFDVTQEEAIKRAVGGEPVPRGTEVSPPGSFTPHSDAAEDILNHGNAQNYALLDDPSEVDPVADMTAELAEYGEEDEEPPPPPSEREQWERRLTLYHESRLWMPDWGPRPGVEGCQVPYEMLNGGGGRSCQ